MDDEAIVKALFEAMPHAHPQGDVPNWEIQPESIKDAFRRKARDARRLERSTGSATNGSHSRVLRSK
jgi:hypothetical protein